MENETGHQVGEAKQQWQTPQLIDLDRGLTAVELAFGAVFDGEGSAPS